MPDLQVFWKMQSIRIGSAAFSFVQGSCSPRQKPQAGALANPKTEINIADARKAASLQEIRSISIKSAGLGCFYGHLLLSCRSCGSQRLRQPRCCLSSSRNLECLAPLLPPGIFAVTRLLFHIFEQRQGFGRVSAFGVDFCAVA